MPDNAADPVRLSLFASRIAAICEEMGALLGRVAFSPNIRDRLDYSCALYDRDGLLLGQATHIPVHLGSMAYAMRGLVGSRTWAPGDMLVLNDPFKGGTHLPDVTFIAPVFSSGQCVGFCANRAHHADIGAEAPGSMPVTTRLEDEGVLIEPVRVLADDRIISEVLDPLLDQLRDGHAALGDFNAQIAANRLGVRRLAELVEGAALPVFDRQCEALQAYAERLVDAEFTSLPEGEWQFTDCLDDDGAGNHDLPIKLRLRIAAGEVGVDFEGTSPQVPGNVNCPMSVTAAAVYYVFRCLLPPQVPACDGAMRRLRLKAPEGCLVNARYPAAVAAGNVETSMRIVDVVCGALAQAIPDRIPAAGQGTMNNLAMGRTGAGGWDYYETIAGGHGGGPGWHGRSARHSHMTNTLNTPVEVLERHYPLLILRYALRAGSGGPGTFHGGDGVTREYLFREDADVSMLSERREHAPWGLNGGGSGATGRNRIDGVDQGGKFHVRARQGQVLTIDTPGGGGFGSPDKLDT